jgi:hypothetical protein
MRRALLPRVLLAFAALAALAPADPVAEPNTEALLDQLDKAFAAPAESLKPPLVIFPLVGEDDRVRPDGAGLSHMATFAAVYTSRKHIALSVPLAQEVLRDTGCTKAKAALDKETIPLCLSALGAKLYAIPKLVTGNDADVLTIACHGDGDKYRDRTFTHTMKPRDLRKVPGLIAQSIQEYLGVSLPPEERERVVAPQVRDERDLRTLLGMAGGRIELGLKEKTIQDLLSRNPDCVAGWELYLNRTTDPAGAAGRFDKPQPAADCPGLRVSHAALIGERGGIERAFRMLLPLVASHKTDAAFLSTLFECAARLKDQRVAYHVLELWRKADMGYSACLARGERLIDWAWPVRGAEWAEKIVFRSAVLRPGGHGTMQVDHDLTSDGGERFLERLEEARRELDQALKVNPSGWAAHAQFIRVVTGLGLPREFMEDHFKKATKLRPRHGPAFAAKLEYLMPRWHGTAEELFDFGQKCAATNFWDEHVPQLFPTALHESCIDPREASLSSDYFRLPVVWDSILAYHRGAQKSADGAERRQILNRLIEWGIRGGRYEEVVVPLQKLRGEGRIDREVFADDEELEFFYDLIHARTGKLMTQLRSPHKNDLALAKTGVALAAGNFEEAARTIERVEPGEHVDRAKVSAYRAAIAAGRKLTQDKSLPLKGAEGLEVFLGARPLWKYGGDQFACTVPAGGRATLTCPIGIRHGLISGGLSWSGDLSYARIVAHTRAPRDKVILHYLPGRAALDTARLAVVDLIRNGRWLGRMPYPAGSPPFRLEYRAGKDSFVPAFGAFGSISWEPVVDNDVPSGFRIEVVAGDRPVLFAISNLRIELKD